MADMSVGSGLDRRLAPERTTHVRAVIAEAHGGPEVLRLAEHDSPQPGPGQLLVDVTTAGGDVRFVLGSEGAGTVAAVGPGVPGVRQGDRVAWTGISGCYAEQVIIPADRAVPVPEEIDLETAGAVMLQGMTAHYLATDTYPVAEGDPAVVHAAAGGVGLLLTQIVKMRGGVVIATTSTLQKAELARAAGADHVAGYDDFGVVVREATGGEGAAVVYDGGGQATFDGSLAALGRRGYMVLCGGASGPVPPVDPQRLNTGGSLFLTRPTLVDYIATREELLARAEDLFGWLRDR